MIGPRSDGTITLEVPILDDTTESVELVIGVEARTMNGTFGGKTDLVRTFPIEEGTDREGRGGFMIIAISAGSLIALIAAGSYIAYSIRRANRKED